jgi:two-component system chemotaxis response regulator CheY
VRRIETNPVKKQLGGKTVLVVEDDPAIRKRVQAAFTSNGFAVCGEADNGKEGIDLAKEIKPDVIILDLSMPVMNGLEAAPQLKRLFPRTPIILFTLHANALLQQQAAHIGVDFVMSKFAGLANLVKKAHALIGD